MQMDTMANQMQSQEGHSEGSDRGSWPECSILARKVSAYQECVHFNCLDIMPLPVVLFSVAAFCYFK